MISLSLATNLPEVNSPKAEAGQANPPNMQIFFCSSIYYFSEIINVASPTQTVGDATEYTLAWALAKSGKGDNLLWSAQKLRHFVDNQARRR